MSKKTPKSKQWTLDVQEDENGDAVIQFPEDLLETTGWQEGDAIEWRDLGNGSWSLSRRDADESEDADESDDIDGWNAVFDTERHQSSDTLRVPITRETINRLAQLMQATDLDKVEMVVSHASGIGPSVSFSYRGVIDATDYGDW